MPLDVQANRAPSALMLGKIVDRGGTVSVNAKRIWLGPQALVDVSGKVVANSRFGLPGGLPVSAAIVPGGTVIFDNADNAGVVPTGSYVVAQAGALVDVSGVAADVLVQGTGRGAADSIALWSDAGTVDVNA